MKDATPLLYLDDGLSPHIFGRSVRVFNPTERAWKSYPIVKRLTVVFYAPPNGAMQVHGEIDPLPNEQPDTHENDLGALFLLRERIDEILNQYDNQTLEVA